jgi:hypothetical protein
VQIFRDEGEDGDKKRDWKDEKKSEDLMGDNHEERDEEKEDNGKDKVGNSVFHILSFFMGGGEKLIERYQSYVLCMSVFKSVFPVDFF